MKISGFPISKFVEPQIFRPYGHFFDIFLESAKSGLQKMKKKIKILSWNFDNVKTIALL